MPLYETVMQYHVESSDEEEDEDPLEDKKFLIASRRVRNKIYANRAAYDEIDGNLSNRYKNPLTIIQVKNPSKNLDCSDMNYNFPSGILRFTLLASLIGFTTLIIGVLAWHLPCYSCSSVYSTSSSSADYPYTQSFTSRNEWVITFDDLVLISGLEVISSSVVVSGYSENTSSYGMIGFDPESGQILWKRSISSIIHKHGCHLIDVNGDGIKDCIVTGDSGIFAAINPVNGAELWYTRHHIPLTNLSLPRKLPDLNNDGIPELLSAAAVTLPSGVKDHRQHVRNNLVLLSGKTGKVLGRPYLIEECTDLGAVNLTSKLAIQFDCTSAVGPDQFEMSLEEFYAKTMHKELPQAIADMTTPQGSEFYQFESIGIDSSETIRDSIHLDVSPLKSNCPECGVIVKIWDGFAHRILWSQSWRNAVAFQPLSTRYETERWDSPIEGFVFRLWEWESPSDTFKEGIRRQMYPYTYRKKLGYPQSTDVRNEGEEKDDFVIRILNVTETVFYATLNHTKPKLISLVSKKIQQKCIKSFNEHTFECTPHFNSHPNSMVIVQNDSEKDSRQLIIVSHSVIRRKKRWRIQTTLQKKRLQKNIYAMMNVS
ncbi:uncharacterized protein [Lepeophtheirus salmonis]|uniref:uncharacterized protein n=1 Tax=Lepeophtheirus salmonis TaxID=72036 RepID=UPI001AE864E3|nr:uncharacterized protein LOC121120505 [Lepeophtheirus salmonis]